MTFLIVGFASLAVTLIAIQRKTRAQAVCLRANAKLNQELGRNLKKLLGLNRRARILMRAQRAADRAITAAALTGLAPAVAAARTAAAGIKALRYELALEQAAIFGFAKLEVVRARAQLHRAVYEIDGGKVSLELREPLVLAVSKRQPREIAPEFKVKSNFARRQAVRIRFEVPLSPRLVGSEVAQIAQVTACTVTLRKDGSRWRPKISAASARSNSPFARSR